MKLNITKVSLILALIVVGIVAVSMLEQGAQQPSGNTVADVQSVTNAAPSMQPQAEPATEEQSSQSQAGNLPVEKPANQSSGKVDYTAMSANELANHLIFEADGFKLDQPVQEGGVARQRMMQDETQIICSALRGERASGDDATIIMEAARASIKYPEEGIKLGDWKIGRDLAWSGFGYRIGHRNDDHSKAANGPGGNCYNCHQLATDRTGGSLGPRLVNYGKLRGNTEATRKYAYEMIYNPHAYFPCTQMPRIGANGVLSQEQISHVLAYLLDPESPVNQAEE